jgi:hypothetical protein
VLCVGTMAESWGGWPPAWCVVISTLMVVLVLHLTRHPFYLQVYYRIGNKMVSLVEHDDEQFESHVLNMMLSIKPGFSMQFCLLTQRNQFAGTKCVEVEEVKKKCFANGFC